MKPMTDGQLWNELRAGKKTALESIYRDNFKQLYRYGVKICKNEMLAEDCLQSLFIELWKNRAGLGKTDSIIKYLMVSLRRKIIKELKNIYAKEIDREIVETDFEEELSFEAKLVKGELAIEKAAELEKAFEKLSPRQREVLYLKYYDGMSYEDIGAIMNINYQSVRNLVSRGIKQLQQVLTTIISILFWL
jgi:RNA polymerase sigma factor (sigma-70 family)